MSFKTSPDSHFGTSCNYSRDLLQHQLRLQPWPSYGTSVSAVPAAYLSDAAACYFAESRFTFFWNIPCPTMAGNLVLQVAGDTIACFDE